MPFKEEDYSFIPVIIKNLESNPPAQKAQINALTDSELKYLIAPNAFRAPLSESKEVQFIYPTPLHWLTFEECDFGLKTLFDRIQKIHSENRLDEKNEHKECKNGVLDDIVDLEIKTEKDTTNLFELVTSQSSTVFKKFLTLISDETLKKVLANQKSSFITNIQLDVEAPSGLQILLEKLPKEIISLCATKKHVAGEPSFWWAAQNFDATHFCLLLQRMTDETIYQVITQQNEDRTTAFQQAALEQNSIGFSALLNRIPQGITEVVTIAQDAKGVSGFQSVAKTQDVPCFTLLLSKMSDESINLCAKNQDSDKTSGFRTVTLTHNSQTFIALINRLSDETINDVISREEKQPTSFMSAARNLDYTALTLLFQKISPFTFILIDPDNQLSKELNSNNNLSADEKSYLTKWYSNRIFFIKEPLRAIHEKPQEFIDFVSEHLKNQHPLNSDQWVAFLENLLTACANTMSDKYYDQMLVLLSRAYLSHYEQSKTLTSDYHSHIYDTLFKLKDLKHLDSLDNEFVGDCFTRFGSPLSEYKDEFFLNSIQGIESSLVSMNYSSLYRKGLIHLKHAADNKNENALNLLQRQLFSFDSIPESPATKSFAIRLDNTLKKLQEKENILNEAGWNKCSTQLMKATQFKKEFSDDKSVEALFAWKIQFEKAKLNSPRQFQMLSNIQQLLNEELIAHPPKKSCSSLFCGRYSYHTWLIDTSKFLTDFIKEFKQEYYEISKWFSNYSFTI